MLNDENGQPVKNSCGMKITFSILEILCCCGCNLITMIMGIIGCVFTSKANSAYKSGDVQEYKRNSKSATICLWIGFAIALVWLVFSIIFSVLYSNDIEDAFMEGYNEAAGVSDDYDTDDFMGDSGDEEYDTDDFLADDSEDTEDAKTVAPLDVTAGDAFDSGDITVNGILVQLPMSYSDFKALGFSIDSEDEEYVSNKNEYYYPTFYDAQGNELGEVYIGNVTDDPQTLADGTVFGFSFTSMDYNDDLEILLPNGLTKDAVNDDFMTAYGEPDYEYESDTGDYQSYQWYSHSDTYEDMDENSISVTFYDGELSDLELMYIGWD